MACFVWVVMILGLRVAPLPCVISNRALMALDVAAKGLRTLSQQKRTLLSKASQSPLNDVSWCLRAKSSFTELTYGRRMDQCRSVGIGFHDRVLTKHSFRAYRKKGCLDTVSFMAFVLSIL